MIRRLKVKLTSVATWLQTAGVAKIWRSEVNEQPSVVVLSPYLTSRTADEVIAAAAGPARIYTLFKAELFATGASSIRTLRRLAEAGHELYELEDLHAKVVLVEGRFASVGSQNLTSGGTKRRELTAMFRDISAVRAVQALIEPWTEDAFHITMERIEQMEARLGPLTKLARQLNEAADLVDEALAPLRGPASPGFAARAIARQIRGKRLTKLQGVIREATLSFPKRGTVRRAGDRMTLKVKGQSLLEWYLATLEYIYLQPKHRYLCINEDRGIIGWARVNKTRITFINGGLNFEEPHEIGPYTFHIKFKALWDDAAAANLEIELAHVAMWRGLRVRAWFDSRDLEVIDTDFWPTEPAASDRFANAARWIREHHVQFAQVIVPLLTDPFKYKENLVGATAASFFGPEGTEVDVFVGNDWGVPVLVTRDV
ncbi:phospholipase D-like domain-containing protein [Cupriavidus sp. 30B13]|uniref:phospholipase D-like domain-containing protein n=1 Tax=Cupriavidus sp. 30B13 TaxID=3384241 RepID=UPI003B908D46